jgi:hypothetical protein
MNKCHLCTLEKTLSGSHIIPRTFLKRTKGGDAQLIKIDSAEDSKPKYDNANWHELLLCEHCERHLNLKYESSQIAYLRKRKSYISSDIKVTYANFDFERFYILWLSIIWRASISSLDIYDNVSFTSEVNELMRNVILSGKTRTNGVCFSDVFQIGVAKITLPPEIDQSLLKGLMTNFLNEHDEDSMNFHLILEGFLISFHFSSNRNKVLPRTFGLLKHSFLFRMPLISVFDSPITQRVFESTVKKASQHPNTARTKRR